LPQFLGLNHPLAAAAMAKRGEPGEVP